ncbi:intraflagellar transport protein 46-like [Pelomyxa schiedti]|nr:intraflagellar transport protein 46-like [Pelomyxa schiedti]
MENDPLPGEGDENYEEENAGGGGATARETTPRNAPEGGSDEDPLTKPVGFGGAADSDEGYDGYPEHESEEEQQPAPKPRVYNKEAYQKLNVSAEVASIFQFIDSYNLPKFQLETTFKPFIPDYIPAVGEVDAFIKVPLPPPPPGQEKDFSNEEILGDASDVLGITTLDEPGKQSDTTVLEMALRMASKKTGLPTMEIRGIENAEKKPKEITGWIEKIAKLHAEHPSPQANLSHPMPSIESLMQEWPPEVEELLEKITIPNGSLDIELKDYVKILCAILDIPVYDNLVESLHILFSLFSAFRESEHFNPNQAPPTETGDQS